MFCFQCEQTSKGSGCTSFGVCGKDPETAVLQDILLHVAMGVSMYAHRARALNVIDHNADTFVLDALFTTVTNVNFDPKRLESLIRRGVLVRNNLRTAYEDACHSNTRSPEPLYGPAVFEPSLSRDEMIRQGEYVSIERREEKFGKDITSLQELLTYGLKGMAAYATHARILNHEDDTVYAYFHEALNSLTRDNLTIEELLGMCLQCGKMNLAVMEMLDAANTSTYGNPIPTRVRITPVSGKAILVSGHDLNDLERLLIQTSGTGINVYTHGEMLPAHGYPLLKKYPHLVGNYGGAWQDQAREFDAFPGAILMTTNCIQKPRESYSNRIFTSGLVAWPGVVHVENQDFTSVIESTLNAAGFAEDAQEQYITVGFGHEAVIRVADTIVDAVKSGAIRRFFLIGGCDGAKSGRNYYTDFAQATPNDTVILTLACGKYRFNKLNLGYIGEIPRLLDIGQCNDAYSAVKIAVALAKAFNTDVNGIPLSFILSWYEQKAVAVLLTLLSLGIRGIRLGPTLPAFITPTILDVLVRNYNIKPITTVEEDLRSTLSE